MISLICGILWTNWTNKQNRDRLTDTEQADSSGEGWKGGRIKQEGKKKKTHGQQCGNCGEEGIGAKNGDEKKSPLQENQDGGVGRHTAPPRTTRTDRKSKGKEVRHQGNKK